MFILINMFKKLIYILPFLWVSLFGQVDTNTIAIPNYFYIGEDFNEGWWVGKIYTPFYHDTTNAITFSLIDDFNGAFSINSATGNITIADSTLITDKIYQQDTLIKLLFTASDATQTDTIDTCYIGIKESSYCTYYDLDAVSNGDGSINNPYNEIDNGAGFAAGEGYFLKCGTTSNDDIDLDEIISTIANPLIMSSYGPGDPDSRPVIDRNDPGTYNDYCLHMGGSYARSANIQIYNMEFQEGGSGVFIRYPCDSIYVNNCFAHDMGISGAGFVGFWSIDSVEKKTAQREHWFRHCESNYNSEHGGKAQNSGVYFFNFKAHNNGQKGLSITACCSVCGAQYVYSYDNTYGMDCGADSSLVQDALLYSNYNGIAIDDVIDKNDSIIHKRLSIIDNSHYGIQITDSAYNYYLEDSYLSGNADGTIHVVCTGHNLNFNRNILIGTGTSDIVYLADDDNNPQAYPDSITFAYNLFLNAGDDGIQGQQSTKLWIINNTFYNNTDDDVFLTASATDNHAINNLYKQWDYSATTMNIDSCFGYDTDTSIFVSAKDYDFRLDSTSNSWNNIINQGMDLGYSEDIRGVSIEGAPDIGAFEYGGLPLAGDTLTIDTIYAIQDAYVRAGTYADDNFGSSGDMIVKYWKFAGADSTVEYSNNREGVVKFLMTNITDSVQNAKLGLYVFDPGNGIHSAFEYENNWHEDTITWNNAPTIGDSIAGTVLTEAIEDQYVFINVTDYVNEKYSLSADTISFRIKSDTSDFIRYYTTEFGIPPILVLDYVAEDSLKADTVTITGRAYHEEYSGGTIGIVYLIEVEDTSAIIIPEFSEVSLDTGDTLWLFEDNTRTDTLGVFTSTDSPSDTIETSGNTLVIQHLSNDRNNTSVFQFRYNMFYKEGDKYRRIKLKVL